MKLNYLYDKEVLQKYCQKYDHEFDEATYDAIVTDIENQNLKDSTGKIKNICNIDTPVNPEKFKVELSRVIDSTMSVYMELEQVIFHRA